MHQDGKLLDAGNPETFQSTLRLFGLDVQAYGTVVRAHDIGLNERVFNLCHEIFRDKKIINAPTNISGPHIKPVAPPSVLIRLRGKRPEAIHLPMRNKFIDPGPLLRQESRVFFIGFWVFQVNGLVGGIHISGNY